LAYTIFGAIGLVHMIVKDLAQTGNFGELPTGTAKDYIHNQSNKYPNGYVFGQCTNLENCSIYNSCSLVSDYKKPEIVHKRHQNDGLNICHSNLIHE
jgi:hypothetical protein